MEYLVRMLETKHPELPTIDNGPSETEMVAEIFAEATRQKLKHTDLAHRAGLSVQKIQRIKAGASTPKIDEFRSLCKAVNKTWREIEDAATFHHGQPAAN